MLTRKRLQLLPFMERHLTQRYVGWLNDPEVVRYSQQKHRKHTMESCRSYIASMKNAPFWAIEVDSQHVGNISVAIDYHNEAADISILIGERSLWGQGYGLEAWNLAIESMRQMRMRLITGGCMATNKGMLRVMEKSGMKPYFVRKNYFCDDDGLVDSVHYRCE